MKGQNKLLKTKQVTSKRQSKVPMCFVNDLASLIIQSPNFKLVKLRLKFRSSKLNPNNALCRLPGGPLQASFGGLMRSTRTAVSAAMLGSKSSRGKFHNFVDFEICSRSRWCFSLQKFPIFSLIKFQKHPSFQIFVFWCYEIITFVYFLTRCAKQT